MSINSFGAVVSDNDGSAFITKAEFDSLKNNFQSQIDQYNTSIDSKIDGAIAGYLAGVNIAKESKITVLLKEDGKYGNLTLKWCSGNSVWDSESVKYANNVYNIADFDWDSADRDSSKKTWSGSSVRYAGYLRAFGEHVGVSSLDDVTYLTSKTVKFINSKNESEWIFQRTNMYTSLYLNMMQWTPYRNAATTISSPGYWNMGGPQGVLRNNNALIKQDVTNVYIDTFSAGGAVTKEYSYAPKWSYAFDGAITTRSTELDQNWTFELLCPLSTADDYYWDTQDKTSYVRLINYADYRLGTRYTTPNSYSGDTDSGWPLHTEMNSVDFTPRVWTSIGVPWCEKATASNAMKLMSLKNVNEDNQRIKNGIILCKVEEAGTLNITVNADYVGTVDFYVSKNPTDTWSESTVQTFNITEANKDTKCKLTELEDADVNKYVWLRYLPTDTTVKGTLKITNATITTG